MELKEAQKLAVETLKKGDQHFSVEHDEKNLVFHLIEELGELVGEIGKEHYRNQETDKINLEGEFADVLIFLLGLADNRGIDVETAMKNKIKVLEERWMK